MRSLLAPVLEAVDDDDLVARYAYDEAALPWVRANMVSSVDGAASGADARSGSVSAPADRRVFHVLRGLADVIVAGSRTVQVERFGPADPEVATAEHRRRLGQAPAAVIAVTSSRLDLELDGPLLAGPRSAVLVLTSEAAAPDRRRAVEERTDVLVVGTDRIDPAKAVAALAERGLRRVLCEGGPALLAAFAAAGCLDELCLTTSPLLLGADAGRILTGPALDPPARLRLADLLTEDDVLLGRWKVLR